MCKGPGARSVSFATFAAERTSNVARRWQKRTCGGSCRRRAPTSHVGGRAGEHRVPRRPPRDPRRPKERRPMMSNGGKETDGGSTPRRHHRRSVAAPCRRGAAEQRASEREEEDQTTDDRSVVGSSSRVARAARRGRASGPRVEQATRHGGGGRRHSPHRKGDAAGVARDRTPLKQNPYGDYVWRPSPKERRDIAASQHAPTA